MKYVGNVQSQANAEIYATASGTLPNGTPVVVNSDGTVSVISGRQQAQAVGSNYAFPAMGVSGKASHMAACLDPDRNKIIVAFSRDGPGYALAVSLSSGLAFTFGTHHQFETGNVNFTTIVYDTNSDRVVIAYRDVSNTNRGTAVVGAVNADNSISFGTPVVFETGATIGISSAFDTSSNKVVIGYSDNTNSGYPTAIVGTVNPSNNSISFGTAVVVKSRVCAYAEVVNDPNAGKIVYIWNDNNAIGLAAVGTVSNTTISFGTHVALLIAYGSFGQSRATFKSDTNQIVVFYGQTGGNGGTGGYVRVGAISGTNISFGDAKKIPNAGGGAIYRPGVVYDTSTSQLFLSYLDAAVLSRLYAIVATVSGTTVTTGAAISMNNNAPNMLGLTTLFDTNSNRVALFFNTGQYGYAEGFTPVFDNLNLTAENFVGITNGVVDYDEGPAATGSEVVFESTRADQTISVYDSNSNRVVVVYRRYGGGQSSLSVIVGTVSGTSISFGTSVVAVNNNVINQGVWPASVCFDSNSNKVVIGYSNASNSNYGTAIVGTVNPANNSISFGTPVVYESAAVTSSSSDFDSNSNKVVIAYGDGGNSSYGTAIVGTVSGTNISFGSAVVFESASLGLSSRNTSSVFDSNLNKMVIAYSDAGNSNYGTAIVGTVSGTNISFGTAVVFEAADTGSPGNLSSTFDSNSNKVVFVYRDGGNSNYATAIVGTVSGTAISFGTAVVFVSAQLNYSDTVFNSDSNKVGIVVGHNPVSETYGKLIQGTVSGTSISFDTITNVTPGIYTQYPSTAFDPTAKAYVLAYNKGNNDTGNSIVFRPAFDNTVRGSTASGSTAIIQAGGAVNTLQTGLTAGQQYFVQTDGTLGLTAGNPSVIAGTAVSATDLIVKG